jgi:hypothetical protein
LPNFSREKGFTSRETGFISREIEKISREIKKISRVVSALLNQSDSTGLGFFHRNNQIIVISHRRSSSRQSVNGWQFDSKTVGNILLGGI